MPSFVILKCRLVLPSCQVVFHFRLMTFDLKAIIYLEFTARPVALPAKEEAVLYSISISKEVFRYKLLLYIRVMGAYFAGNTAYIVSQKS
jgi:hypothetical protein